MNESAFIFKQLVKRAMSDRASFLAVCSSVPGLGLQVFPALSLFSDVEGGQWGRSCSSGLHEDQSGNSISELQALVSGEISLWPKAQFQHLLA